MEKAIEVTAEVIEPTDKLQVTYTPAVFNDNLAALDAYVDKQIAPYVGAQIEKIKRKKTPPKRARGKLDYRSMKRSEQVVIEEETFYIAVLQRELNRKARRCQRIKKDFCESQNK